MLDGTVHIPGMGNVPKKGAAIGAVITVGIVGVAYMRHRNAAGTATPVDTSATDTSAVSPTDGSFSLDPSGNGGSGDLTGFGSITPQPPSPTGSTFSTNAEWAGQVEGDLGGSDAIAAAINKVLGGVPVTTAQKQIFEQGLGLEGPPPFPYPPIHVIDTPGQPKPPVKKYITANGHEDLHKIAVAHHMTEQKLVQLNIGLLHYVGTGHPVKKGTKVRVA